MVFKALNEIENTVFVRKIGKQRRSAQFAQTLHAGFFAAIADDHGVAVSQQLFGTVQTNALASTRDQNRSTRRGHDGLGIERPETVAA